MLLGMIIIVIGLCCISSQIGTTNKRLKEMVGQLKDFRRAVGIDERK